MAGLGIHIGDAYYVNGVFAAGFRGHLPGSGTDGFGGVVARADTWRHVVARPTCYIGRKILEDFGLPKTFNIRPGSNWTREECQVLACAWVDRMHFFSQHLTLARSSSGEAICTHADPKALHNVG